MHRRASFIPLLALLGVPLWLAACMPAKPLTVGVHPWIGYESLYLARDFGWLPPSLDLRTNTAAGNSLAALKAGTIDAAALTLDEVLLARAAGVPLTVVLVFDSSAGADVLLARPQITSMAALAGKRVGYEPTAVGTLVLSEVLTRAGLSIDAIRPVELTPPGQLAAWRSGELDAVVSYEPTATLLRHAGAVPLFDSRQMPDTIFDVLAVRSDRLAGRETALRALLVAHFRALDQLRDHRRDTVLRLVAHQHITADEVQHTLSGVVMPDLAGNRYALGGNSRFEQAVHRLHELMVERALLPHPDNLDNLYTAAYLPAPKPATP